MSEVSRSCNMAGCDGGCDFCRHPVIYFDCETCGGKGGMHAETCTFMAGLAAHPADPANPDLHRFDSGAVRSTDADRERWDLIFPVALRRVAETCHEGSQKYGDYNCEKGIPVSNLLNHAIRHLFLYLDGDRTEDHLAHATWNVMASMHMEERMPEMAVGLREVKR